MTSHRMTEPRRYKRPLVVDVPAGLQPTEQGFLNPHSKPSSRSLRQTLLALERVPEHWPNLARALEEEGA